MTNSIDDLHVYLRSIAEGERTSLSVLAGLVHPGATVLDLGCGSGALGQFLKETRQCTADGVTLSQAEARIASPHYRQVEVADLETADLPAMFPERRYDFIVCADVLEHLKHPEQVLKACRNLLEPDGKVLISVPNAGYSGLVAELLEGEFRYREEGLLDRTHLRFFTRRSLVRFMSDQRWQINSLDTITRELPESEFKVAFDSLPAGVARYLLGANDALTYQFICVASPAEQAVNHAFEPVSAATDEPQARFTAQLYLGRAAGYEEASKLTATGIIGHERQTLVFRLPAREEPLTRLRLDPADRPGFLHLYGLNLRDGTGHSIWHWTADHASRSLMAGAPHSQIVWNAPLPPAAGATLLLLAGTDPWFTLPIPEDVLQQLAATEAFLDVELGWPMSADYLALAGTVRPLGDRIDQLERDARETQSLLEDQLQHARASLSSTTARNSLLEENNTALARQRAMWQQEATRVQKDYAELAAHLKTIENSTVFRATRPLVHAKMRLDRLLGRGPAVTAAPAALPVPMAAPHHPVDVIVPVYRGLADTRLCIDSALASTCQTPWRLIVINDASPEPEVTVWLRERAQQDSRITLLENAENLGFVGTVNRGMALSNSNDVLLLNSDTEVANDWLDRIRRAAYSDQKVASVTPFSNNATICSYPRFCKDNELPEGYDTARLDALCASTNPGAVVDVPTGVGFCMYIRRDSLAAVGLFDTENFGKGYGEENDFCQRAAAAGWRNLHLLDTFVLHTGGVSFGESKSPRERAAMETLRRLHPRYERDVMAFVQADPAQPYRLALDIARLQQAHLPVVLAVLHDRAGGTLRHVRELAEHLRSQARFLVLTPAPDQSVSLRMAGEHDAFELRFSMATQYEALVEALRHLGVAHIHYHHLLGHDERILDLPSQLGVDYDFTAHDFYSYCTHISLTGRDNRYQADRAPGECHCCAPDDPAPYGGSVRQWRHRNRHFLTGARQVFAPSHDTAARIAGLAPGARLRVVPHTDLVDASGDAAVQGPPALPEPQARTLANASAPLKVVVLGALSAIKGADLLEAVAAEAARRNAPVEFHLLGYGYRHLLTQPRARLTVHGAYDEADLPRLLEWLQPDIAWFPALWPETYSYTLSACLQAGLPVLAPDLGAFPERLAGRARSWVAPWDQTAGQWLDSLLTLRANEFLPLHNESVTQGLSVQGASGGMPRKVVSITRDDSEPWHYRSGYLPRVTARNAELLSQEFIRTHQPAFSQPDGAKSVVLNGLVRLRSMPVLRSLAKAIPPHLQRQVKNWLRS
ncbi:methyltransferase domain-containing protein [Acidovorax sp.]|uniref:methyltransferase domain-containing protein n=1 Tax=Acidovorax sp. TaxID=1872122 RepID=UPI0025BA68BD|nr:methyltransferase domain-containing protein [Acidovorax sp.]